MFSRSCSLELNMARLNYLHLHAFWAVAREGHLTRAAERLHVSPSALSTQIRQLEDQFGQPLFERQRRQLRLTEAGQLALSYAESIFSAGNELLALLREGQGPGRQVLRIGAVATLSRNFQDNLLRPLVRRDDVELLLQSGSLDELLGRLQVHTLDLVLANQAVDGTGDAPWRCRRIARQPVSLVGPAGGEPFLFPADIATRPLLLPSRAHAIRAGFDLWCEQRGLRPVVRAEVDDMAMLRLLARDAGAPALLPTVVVQDELRSGVLRELAVVPGLHEQVYAITVKRHFTPPLLKSLLAQGEAEVLAGPGGAVAADG
jgi:LysR family transcriptional activator of nhaA